MDPDIEELKKLVRQNITLSQETNQIVHSMRNAARWGRIMRVLWILVILVASGAAYVYFAPYLNQLFDLYGRVLSQANNLLDNVPSIPFGQ